MFDSLDDRLDLDQLRRQAKELRDAGRRGESVATQRIARYAPAGKRNLVTLGVAQLVIARELGFASWPKLKARVELDAGLARRAEAFVAACVEGRTRRAQRLFELDARVAHVNIRTAGVVGDARRVEELLAADPSRAHASGGERDWPPLLYVCYSNWHKVEPDKAKGMAGVVRLLLDAGASPDTSNGGGPHHGYRSALHGSVTVNNPGITRLLLERTADPNDGESLYQAAEHRDHRCLRLLLANGATVAGTWALDVAVGRGDAGGVRLLLDAAAAQNSDQVPGLATALLARASATTSTPVVQALLAAGADPSKLDPDGLSPLRQAVRAGNEQVAGDLRRRGVSDDTTTIDRFIGAGAGGDRVAAERLLTEQPQLGEQLSDYDRAAIVDVAGRGAAAVPIRLMLELGFSPQARNTLGETPLHSAAFAGDAETVRLLLQHGADVDARDANFNGTPLGYATVGSGERQGADGDWVTTVRLLLDADADPTGVWVPSSPPAEDVAEALQSFGISGDDHPAE